ncbi:SulP family inorganic anion transporter [Leucobacter luti]|uniref:SulP family sulfate permease n=1 Tax=Leucobacter luti TaxID=340320 RepID=A0A4Q7TS90_9MICO|nr:SulP family inorganic anion transporter [Leucobacter luti]MBL3699892.1 SulP family inorganic anion transporter [Leucobacter luti]RZT62790.1 SulP family sulfate permease [Leucobacter luti]
MSALLSGLRALLPTRADYRGARISWRADLVAGLTVGIVALPLALAFGVSSGVGAEAGLVTAIVAGLVAAVFGGSNVQVSGPTGAMVVVLAPIVVLHGVGAVAVVSLMAGVLVVAAGIFRLGRAVSYIPWPVIEGFTAGIGIIIFLQQVPAALGVEAGGHSSNAVVAAWQVVTEASWPAALLPLAAVAGVALIMVLLGRIAPAIPASFVAILAVSIVTVLAGSPLTTIGTLPSSLPAPSLPALDPATLTALAGPAVAVAALAAIESLLSARVAATIADTGQVNADRELFGQGLASIASGFFGGMPATGAIARTAVNVRSGARTRLAAVIHALALLLVVLVAAPVVGAIPLAALSGVLMMTAARMVSPATIGRVLRSSRSSVAVFAVTLFVTVAFDLVIAVGIGLAVAAFFALRTLSRMSDATREVLPGPAAPGDERIALFTVHGSLFFGAADRLVDQISEAPDVAVVVLRLSDVQIIDATGANALAELVSALERRGVTVLIKGVRPEHRRLLEQLGVIRSLRDPGHLFTELAPALDHARDHVRREAASQ